MFWAILLSGGAVGYVFCEDAMADYLEKNITQVRHTTMTTEVTKECPAQAAPQFAEEEFVVSSNRCDAVVSKAYRLSRTQSADYSGQEKYCKWKTI